MGLETWDIFNGIVSWKCKIYLKGIGNWRLGLIGEIAA